MKTLTAIKKYNKLRLNQTYIIGFEYEGMVYGWWTPTLPHKALYMDDNNLRMHFSQAIKRQVIKKKTCKPLCNIEALDGFKDKSIHCINRGEAFERMISEEVYNISWEKDYVPFTKGNDLLNISIKYANKCTIARAKSLGGK